MLYSYATFPNHLNITFSQIIQDGSVEGGEKVFVNFKQPNNDGFKETRYLLPDKKLVYNDGFLLEEQRKIERILDDNEELIMKYAKLGGVKLT